MGRLVGVAPVELVVLAGVGAGASLLLSFAFASALGAAAAARAGGAVAGPHVRFLVSAPDTYLYLDATRPAPHCRPARDTGPAADWCVRGEGRRGEGRGVRSWRPSTPD